MLLGLTIQTAIQTDGRPRKDRILFSRKWPWHSVYSTDQWETPLTVRRFTRLSVPTVTTLLRPFLASPRVSASSTRPLCSSRSFWRPWQAPLRHLHQLPSAVLPAPPLPPTPPPPSNMLSLFWPMRPASHATLVPTSARGAFLPRNASPPQPNPHQRPRPGSSHPSCHASASKWSHPHAQRSSQAAHLFLSGLYVLEFCPLNENEVRTQIRALPYTRWHAPHSPRGKVLSK